VGVVENGVKALRGTANLTLRYIYLELIGKEEYGEWE
jgi:hypothetical protein